MDRVSTTAAARAVYELDVTGMSCGSCAARLQGALGSEPGVADALVNLATGRARVDADAGGVEPERLVEIVERLGYGARPVSDRALAGPGGRRVRGNRGVRGRRLAAAGRWSPRR